MGGKKQDPQAADYTPAQEPIALTAGARGRMSSLLTILALLLILFCGTYLARALINRYLDLAETEVPSTHLIFCAHCLSSTRRRIHRCVWLGKIPEYYNGFSQKYQVFFSFFFDLAGCNIKCERTSPLFSGSFEPSAFIFLYHKPR